MLRIERTAEAIWNNRITSFLLLCSPYVASAIFCFAPQLPGVAAVVLGGIAAVMTFRDMHHTHKLLFTGAILLLVFIEFRDIRIDRVNSDNNAKNDLAEQARQFKEIRDAQNTEFKKTADGLEAAISGIDSTLKTANQTMKQTRPSARLHFSGMFSIINLPTPLSIISDVPYAFRSDTTNDGNDVGNLLRALRKIYVGKPDDRKAQESLAMQFNSEWEKLARERKPDPVPVNRVGYRTDERIFTAEEIKQISEGATIYVLRRLEYTDSTGTWLSEDCQHFQVHDHSLYFAVGHPCLVFDRSKARVP
jgi:hypothetical protein